MPGSYLWLIKKRSEKASELNVAMGGLLYKKQNGTVFYIYYIVEYGKMICDECHGLYNVI
jgi:hypothetical protein